MHLYMGVCLKAVQFCQIIFKIFLYIYEVYKTLLVMLYVHINHKIM